MLDAPVVDEIGLAPRSLTERMRRSPRSPPSMPMPSIVRRAFRARPSMRWQARPARHMVPAHRSAAKEPAICRDRRSLRHPRPGLRLRRHGLRHAPDQAVEPRSATALDSEWHRSFAREIALRSSCCSRRRPPRPASAATCAIDLRRRGRGRALHALVEGRARHLLRAHADAILVTARRAPDAAPPTRCCWCCERRPGLDARKDRRTGTRSACAAPARRASSSTAQGHVEQIIPQAVRRDRGAVHAGDLAHLLEQRLVRHRRRCHGAAPRPSCAPPRASRRQLAARRAAPCRGDDQARRR